uniref:hypothetical protein n=1 Tax=Daejeonella sp. TaxID=2805397 RepID=UPI0037BEE1B4
EIERLGQVRVEMETDLKIEVEKITTKITAPFLLLNKLSQFLGISKGKEEGKDEGDWVSSIFRIGLPVLMNKFIFPKSGFLMKALLALVTQNAAKAFDKDFMGKMIDKISDWLKKSGGKRKKDPEMADYGIPPDSETY